jgi:hypothetical protein
MNKITFLSMDICINSATFINKIDFGTHSDPKFGWRGGGVIILMPRKKGFQNTVPACIILRKNFQNGVPSQKYNCLLMQYILHSHCSLCGYKARILN